MKVTFVDIETTVRDVEPRESFDIATYKGLEPRVMGAEEAMYVNPVHKKTYRVKISYRHWPRVKYALTEDSWAILDELMGIRVQDLSDNVFEKIQLAKLSECSRIKSLPWYKRLFNKF